jgi:hypothetical protein
MNDIRAAEAFPLGDRVVNRLGYGAMQLAGPGVFGPPKNRAGKSQYLVAGNMTALFDAAMVGVGGVVAGLPLCPRADCRKRTGCWPSTRADNRRRRRRSVRRCRSGSPWRRW